MASWYVLSRVTNKGLWLKWLEQVLAYKAGQHGPVARALGAALGLRAAVGMGQGRGIQAPTLLHYLPTQGPVKLKLHGSAHFPVLTVTFPGLRPTLGRCSVSSPRGISLPTLSHPPASVGVPRSIPVALGLCGL